MKKFSIAVLLITSLSIMYVYQQARLLEHSYNINSCKKTLSLLIDQNKSLRYNIAKLESPARLEEAMLARKETGDYLPVTCYRIRMEELSRPVGEVTPSGPFVNMGRIIMSMFSLNTEAVAVELSE